MPKHNTICSAKCPYYRADERHEIFCAGLKNGMGTHVAFASPAERKLWRDRYCKSTQGHHNCPVKKMLDQNDQGIR